MKKFLLPLFLLPLLLVASTLPTRAQTRGINKINHVVIIFMENWTFDAHYGNFPGANGLPAADAKIIQFDFEQNVLPASGRNVYENVLWFALIGALLIASGALMLNAKHRIA